MRKATKQRQTLETAIDVTLNLDDASSVSIETGVGFFDHMLTLFASHGRFSLEVKATGDLHIDSHHTVEDVGIVIGQLFKEAIGDKVGINRYGTAYVPMDEALGFVSLDISGRPYLVLDADFTTQTLGNFDTELVREFLQAFMVHAGITLHARVLYGINTHHKIEAIFKALGQALAQAIAINPNIKGVNSTKGLLE
ncbi:imidazoleglycerol-phosphate dehydratase [Halolactibacillus alkaliphilus]|uniref:Imidazoleglycerol-phosphate dehydratase n=1 Tax=Halolactibacillus alkaliphilus TaxID=442899 RepID=A0A511X000_9BACI|nr:imidazoleglycerol-phosphate dehydratase HisB [Halolactibacillus alkaliphilus]GEN56250.1 imidazoleglycerol-phosphate dehydratase [Halolactibacillus alkaliphilus]GGN66396.1 imidazoleglycerol-phosphate dehydratase [Halolactibacillus alkaliphilus]SFO67535.1 imidazoleglycerol-phosphate dehydratase [Halolactibacillus alkaliphilus]